MANPFDEPTNYGTVSGESTGFRGSSRPGSQEFTTMKQRAADSIMIVNQQTQALRSLQSKLGTGADNDALRRRIHNLLRDTKEKLQLATSQLSELVQLIRGGAEQGQQLAVQSLRHNMQKAAREFTQVYEAIRDAMQDQALTPKDGQGYLDSDHVVDMGDDRARLIKRKKVEEEDEGQQQAQTFVVAGEIGIFEERAERMQELEGDIVELHGIMSEIGQMVVEQQATVNTIEAAVETAGAEVEKGNRQLSTAVKYKRCSRKLVCIICTVCVIILLIVAAIITVVAVVLSKH